MKKINLMPVLALLLICFNSHAAFVLNSTRYIFAGDKDNISVQVNNESSQEYGGQIWIDNANARDQNVYFAPSPTFFKVSGGHRLLKINDSLPKDKESLFWVNVQEIPKAPKEGTNSLAIALHTQVKMIYRPESLKEGREDAEKNIKIIHEGGNTILYNNSPYYFAVINVKQNGHDVKLSEETKNKIAAFAPFEKVSLGSKLSGKDISIVSFDDYGVDREYKL
ncbi:fimbrial chaperone [Escherichia coli]|uniref:fimbrial chaperone n=1 Tax=Escherichia coli TaxID=562 RepID=UPI00222F22AB|nr:fimbrial chaperone [Escherichia coli]MDM9349890.1 fimbrial chaperone [Escherichia coli]WNU29505.1 fimbrial chaperone [Escherichia coli]